MNNMICCLCEANLQLQTSDHVHVFNCAHLLCANCRKGFSNSDLRDVCFTCASPEPKSHIRLLKHEDTKRDALTVEIIHPERTSPLMKKAQTHLEADSIYNRRSPSLFGGENPPVRDESANRTGVPMGLAELEQSLREKVLEIQRSETDVAAHFNDARKLIEKHAKMCRALINRDEKRLLQQLDEMRESAMRKSNRVKSDIGNLVDRLERARPENVFSHAETPETEVAKLMSTRISPTQFPEFEVTLNDISRSDGGNVLAQLTLLDADPETPSFFSVPALLGSIEREEPNHRFSRRDETPEEAEGARGSCMGVAVLDDEVFTIYDNSAEVSVFRIGSWGQMRSVSLRYLVDAVPLPSAVFDLVDLAACRSNKCLYVADWQNNFIFRLRQTDGSLKGHWRVMDPRGVSVTETGSVLVGCGKAVMEFDAGGRVLHTISTSPISQMSCRLGIRERPVMKHPRHPVQLDSDKIVVSDFKDDTTPHVIYEIDRRGNIAQWHGGRPASGAENMNQPRHLAAAASGHVFVADRANHRVKLLNRKLEFVKDLVRSEQGQGLRSPIRLYFDRARGHLYVGQSSGHTLVYRIML